MRRSLIHILISTLALAGTFPAQAAPTPYPPGAGNFGGTLTNEGDSLLKLKENPAGRRQTEDMIDQNARLTVSGSRDQGELARNLIIGQERAAQMVQILKDEQFRMALEKANARGKEILEENQALRNPAAVIAGAASLWFGTTLRCSSPTPSRSRAGSKEEREGASSISGRLS
jgi:hypothetical protein